MPGSQKDDGDFIFQLDYTFLVDRNTRSRSLSFSLSVTLSHTHTHIPTHTRSPGNTVGMASLLVDVTCTPWNLLSCNGRQQTRPRLHQEYICNQPEGQCGVFFSSQDLEVLLGVHSGPNNRKLWQLPGKVQKPESSLGATAQSSPLPQSSSRVYALRLSPGMSAVETCPVSANTPGFHCGPPLGTMIQKVITVIKLATWGKSKRFPPLCKALRNLRAYPETLIFPWKPKERWILPALTPASYIVGFGV